MMNARNMIMMAAASVALFAACRKENLKEERKPLPKHDKLALEYVAQKDLSAAVKSVGNAKIGYFTYAEAVDRFSSFKIGNEDWHLPTLKELKGIFPDKGLVSFTEKGEKTGVEEEIMLAGEVKVYHADYENTGAGVTYAVRFIGNGDKQLSAWRYRLVDTGKETAALEITCRYIDRADRKSLKNVSNEAFWNTDNMGDVVRLFPLKGYKKGDNVFGIGSVYHTWAADERNADKAWRATAMSVGAFTLYSDKNEAVPVRLFQGTPPQKTFKMAIKYVTEYNLDVDGRAFAVSHENDKAGGLFSFYETKNRFKSWREKNGDDTYHVPSVEELRGIIPDKESVCFTKDTTVNVEEDIEVHKEKYVYKADYHNSGKGISYAIRFKGNGNVQLSAWRYKVCGSFKEKSKDSHIEVRCRYLGPDKANVSLETVSDEKYWEKDNDGDVVRIFSAMGYRPSYNEQVLYMGTDCRVWTRSEDMESKLAWYAFMYNRKAYLGKIIKEAQLPVRLFSDN